jgi:hypothetical protein
MDLPLRLLRSQIFEKLLGEGGVMCDHVFSYTLPHLIETLLSNQVHKVLEDA